MRVLVIPDCHLKPWMFEDATAIMNSGKADNAVCLMDIPDDFGKDDPDLYKKAYDAAIRFAERFPQSLWCYGNHDLSYVWNKPETGFNPAVRMLVREKLEELERTLSSPSQLAYIHPIKNSRFLFAVPVRAALTRICFAMPHIICLALRNTMVKVRLALSTITVR